LKIENTDGSTSIPALTENAEHLSTLKTLKEVREKWDENTGTRNHVPMSLFGGLFGTVATPAKAPRMSMATKAKRTTKPVM
jgi:hypothetical protein